MGVTYLQSNLTAGELSPTLHSRPDIDKYVHGVANAENMIIMPHGGLRRRPGLEKTQDAELSAECRIDPFVFNETQAYIVAFSAGGLEIFNGGVSVYTEAVTAWSTMAIVNELDVIQSGDTMIITHETFAPKRLQRQGSHTSWDLADITFVTIPQFDFGSGAEDAWSDTRGWPRVCTFFQGRLWLAGSTQRPTTIWGSKTNGFFDFDVGTGAADDAIDDTLDTDQYNKITNIFAGRDLQVFTTAQEFYNNSKIITPTESGWSPQTGYGSKRVRPVLIDGATLFVDSSKRNVRQYIYDFNEDSYVSANISILSSHLLSDIKEISAIKGTTYDISDFVYCINTDGTVAVFNTMRAQNIAGWTHWKTQGTFVSVAVANKEVYFVVKRYGTYFLEKLNENLYTDHAVLEEVVAGDTYNVVDNGDILIDDNYEVVWTELSNSFSSVTTNYSAVMASVKFSVVADYSIMEDALYTGTPNDNSFTINRLANRIEIGLNYETNVVTLPVSNDTQKGNTMHRRKRIVKVDINVFESLGVYARTRYTSDRQFTVKLDSATEPFTGFKEMYLLGYDRLINVEISQKDPLPFTLRSIGTEIAY